jgi:hypothetical protein
MCISSWQLGPSQPKADNPTAPAVCCPHLHTLIVHMYSLLKELVNAHPHVELASLSSQAASTLQQQHSGGGQVHVLMPTLGVTCSNDCWEGVAVQGR